MDTVDIISIFTGVLSIVLAVVAIILSTNSEKRSAINFTETQKLIEEVKKNIAHFEDIAQNVLHEIDKKTERIEQISSDTKNDIHDNIKRVFESSFPSQEQQAQNQMNGLYGKLIETAIQNPMLFDKLVDISTKTGNK